MCGSLRRWFLWVVILLAGAGVAEAAPPSVIVIATATSGSEATDLVWRVRTALGNDERFTSVNLPLLLDADVNPEAGVDALKAGTNALDNLEMGSARKRLELAALWLGSDPNGSATLYRRSCSFSHGL